MALDDLPTYSEFIYTLPNRYASIQHSTLILVPLGATLAKLEGEITFASGVTLRVWELIDFDARRIRNYSYEIYRAGQKIAWYDPFEHPQAPELASTYPHHKHILSADQAARPSSSIFSRQ